MSYHPQNTRVTGTGRGVPANPTSDRLAGLGFSATGQSYPGGGQLSPSVTSPTGQSYPGGGQWPASVTSPIGQSYSGSGQWPTSVTSPIGSVVSVNRHLLETSPRVSLPGPVSVGVAAQCGQSQAGRGSSDSSFLLESLGNTYSVDRIKDSGSGGRGKTDSSDLQTGSDRNGKMEKPAAMNMSGTSDLKVHGSAGKGNVLSQSGQTAGVSSRDSSQEGSSLQTSESPGGATQAASETTNSDNTKASDQQNVFSAPKEHLQELQTDLSHKMKLRFEAHKAGRSHNILKFSFPDEIDVAKWNLLKSCRIQESFKIDGSDDVHIDQTDRLVIVTNLTAKRSKEISDWFKECVRILSELLLGLQSVTLKVIDIAFEQYLKKTQIEGLYFRTDSNKRCLTVFAISSEAMDKFMQTAAPLLRTVTGGMVIRVSFHLQTLRMLELLGFREYYEECTKGVKLELHDSEYCLHCSADLRHSLVSQSQEFLKQQVRGYLHVPELYKFFLLGTKNFFQDEVVRNQLRCWFSEKQGVIEVLSPSKEMLSRVETMIIENMMCLTVWSDTDKTIHCLKKHPGLTQFWYEPSADGRSVVIAGFKQMMDRLRKDLYPVSLAITKAVKVDVSDRLPEQQGVSCSTGRVPGEQQGSGNADEPWRDTQQGDRTGNTDSVQGGRTGNTDSAQQGDRTGNTDSAAQGDKTGNTDSAQQGDGSGMAEESNAEQAGSDRSTTLPESEEQGVPGGTEQKPDTQGQVQHPLQAAQDSGRRREQETTADRNSQRVLQASSGSSQNYELTTFSVTQQPESAQLHDQASQGSDRRQDQGMTPTSSAQHHGSGQHPHTGSPGSQRRQGHEAEHVPSDSSGSHGAEKSNRFHIPREKMQLLQVPDVLHRFKSKLMDKKCMISVQTLPDGFVEISSGSLEDVSSTLQELFHVVEIEEDDPEAEGELESFRKKHEGKVDFVLEKGLWKVCIIADMKNEVSSELEALRISRCRVPLPIYACEFLALNIDRINSDMRQDVDKSATVSIADKEETQGIDLSAERKFMKLAIQWLHDFVLKLEVEKKAITVDEALFLQDLKGQEMIQRIEEALTCRIDTVAENGDYGLRATGPSGQQLIVCGDTMAATDCQCIVLPLCDGQTEWSPLQTFILRSSLLSEDISSYQRRCANGPVRLRGNEDFADKTIIIVSVPALAGGANKEKERIRAAYKEVFDMCRDHTVAVCAKENPTVPLRKSGLKQLLVAVWGTAKDPKPCPCKTVVIYTDSAQDFKTASDVVRKGCSPEWRLKPERLPRTEFWKGAIKVCIGEIQEEEADVIVNSTRCSLKPDKGAVENAIRNAAGEEMLTACKQLYPKGIPVNGLAVTDSFNMKNAKKIYHIALDQDPYTEDCRDVLLHDLGKVVHDCLVRASMDKHTSIAFPTLGSGNLKYPCEAVARVMFTSINNFFREMPHSALHTVKIVVFRLNAEAIQALKMEEMSQLYTFPSSKGKSGRKFEMRLNFKQHRIQVVHGDVYRKPWVTDVCIHGPLSSHREESGSGGGGGCQNVPVEKQSKHAYKDCLRQAFRLGRTDHFGRPIVAVQIAAETLNPDSLGDLAGALESVMQSTEGHVLVSVIFNNEKDFHNFPTLFSFMESGHGESNNEKESPNQVFICAVGNSEDVLRQLGEFQASDRYKKLLDEYQKDVADLTQGRAEAGRDKMKDQKEPQVDQEKTKADPERDNKLLPGHSEDELEEESNQIKITIPNRLLKGVDENKVLKLIGTENKGGQETTGCISLRDLMSTAQEISELLGNRPAEKQAEEQEKTGGAEADSRAVWSRSLDDLQVEALRFLLGAEFEQTLDVKGDPGSYVLTFKGAPSEMLKNQVEALRQEDVQLTPDEISKLGDTVDVKSEGIKAYVKTMASQGKAAVFALDYNAMSRAKHLVTVKAGRIKVTSRVRRRFEQGAAGPGDPVAVQPAPGLSMQTGSFTTPSGIKVSVYKSDITMLPVDAIVNAANENLSHGGGVAYAISRAAGFALEEEGRQHLAQYGPLRVSEVVETTAGRLTCQKVLHAVGPRWHSYPDKAECRQLLVDTVYNCLLKAHSLDFKSIALPSISAAIFGVPQEVCAESYVSGVKMFDDRHGPSTSVREVHFVDVNDAMISAVHSAFSALWSAPAASTAGGQAAQSTAAGGARQKETTGPALTTAGDVHHKRTLEASPRPETIHTQQNPLEASPRPEAIHTQQKTVETSPSPENIHIQQKTVEGSPRPEARANMPATSESSEMPPQGPLNMKPRSEPGQDGQTASMALAQQQPLGCPSLAEVGPDKDGPVQISFENRDLTLVLQKQSAVDIATDSVIMWQDVQNIMKDSIWKRFKKDLNAQALSMADDLKNRMTSVEKVVDLKTMNKHFVFVTLSFNTPYDEHKIRDFVEKALNKVDLFQKTTVAITRIMKQKGRGKASNKDNEDLDVFIRGLFKAVKNYAVRSVRSIREIHLVETEPDMLQSMVDMMKTQVAVEHSLHDQTSPQPPSVPGGAEGNSPRTPDPCNICKDTLTDPKRLTCGHVFCRHCIDQWFVSKPTCPNCNAPQGSWFGNQPEDGKMTMTYSLADRCQGFLFHGSYIVTYSFPSGTQKENHPNPGKRYKSTDRKAYLPDTLEGRKVLMLLKIAFDRRLIFTVGKSITSGEVGIVWNDIQHKTQLFGGPDRYGYPDPEYLVCAMKELANKGITEKDLTDTHREFIKNPYKFHGSLPPYRDFSEDFNEKETGV